MGKTQNGMWKLWERERKDKVYVSSQLLFSQGRDPKQSQIWGLVVVISIWGFLICLFSNVFVFGLYWAYRSSISLHDWYGCSRIRAYWLCLFIVPLWGDFYNHYPDWWSRTTCSSQDCTLKQCVIPGRKTLGFLIQDLIYRFLSTAVSLFNSPDIGRSQQCLIYLLWTTEA